MEALVVPTENLKALENHEIVLCVDSTVTLEDGTT
jgi:hypothetical protein